MLRWVWLGTRSRTPISSIQRCEPRTTIRAKRTMATDAKKDFRKDVKAKLSTLSEAEVAEQSRKAQDLVLQLRQYKEARRISVYLSMPKGEAQTDTIVHDALEQGKTVFVPYIHRPPVGNKIIDMLRLNSFQEFEALGRDGWGIPSLSSDSVDGRENAMGSTGLSTGENPPETEDGEGRKDVGTLDMIVMPGVAFDQGMNRLGHGAGFYDAYLSRFCADGTRKPFLGK